MNKRVTIALLFSVIVAIELILFITSGTPTTFERSGNTLFGGTTSVNYDAKAAQDRMYMIIIGVTVAVGAIVTFAMPQDKK